MAKPSPKSIGVSAVPTAPSGAEYFSLDRITYVMKTNAETGKKHSQTVVNRCQGEAREDGTIPEAWPVGEFATTRVLETHGAGRYKVTWYNKAGDKVSHSIFELANPPGKKTRSQRGGRLGVPYEPIGAVPRAKEDEGGGQGAAEPGLPQSPIGWMMYMQQREEAAAERRRQEAREEDQRRREEHDRQRQSDREFFGMVLQRQPQGQGVDMDLLKRELRVSVQEHMLSLREQFAGNGNDDDNDEPDRDGRKPPRNLDEAGSRVAMAVLEDIEQRAPELLQKMVPELWRWLTEAGYKPSAKVARAMAEAAADGSAE